MPQRSFPQNRQPSNAHTPNRPHFQERRRTLQTISELSVADVVQSHFSTYAKPEPIRRSSCASSAVAEKQAPHLRRQQSLPGYCSNPECHLSLPSPFSPSNQAAHNTGLGRSWEDGNATRGRVRFQEEQQRYEHEASIGSRHGLPERQPSWRQASPPHVTSYASHQRLVPNSRSISGFPRTTKTWANLGSTTGSFGNHHYEIELLERAGSSLSSHHFLPERAAQRSRYGSFNASVAHHAAPRISNTIAGPQTHNHSNVTSFDNHFTPEHSTGPGGVRSGPIRRSSSLPTICARNVDTMPYKYKQSMPRTFQIPDEKEPVVDVQAARLAALAALTGADDVAPHKRRASTPTAMDMSLYLASCSSQQRQRPSAQSRTRSSPSLRGLPSAHGLKSQSSENLIYTQTSQKRGRLPVSASFEVLAVPKRTSLTAWQTERKETKWRVDHVRRADMAERVKRANEQEQEREKELMLMGKGTGTSVQTEKETGCFGGVFGGVFGMFRRGKA